MPSSQGVEKAREIVQKMIDTEAWRDNLHVNDLPYLRGMIADSIDQARNEAIEECAKVADEFPYRHSKFTAMVIRNLKK